ncbi:hypothetical protein [Nodosilinea sp. P-1105]|uniref:hypothetical protein n=1 Tax=Nodosilinea sp. P-1105 TaxID=2546229 RepID=UPI00146BF6D1|nr:hypothetical protein [Nodosilinea sp. P-1105]NMF84635.1 hypothetical protein [Nodosilinea sp. P-1105]
MSVAAIVAGFDCVGFSGSRRPSAASLAAFGWLAGYVAPGAVVVTGCARGIDHAARQQFPSAQVFQASAFGAGRGSFAARSVACVRAVAAAGGLWVSFPATPCPGGVLPSAKSSKAFCGAGSGTWASLAFAVGSGVPCLVFLPAGIAAPAGWGLQSLGGGWFHFAPAIVQPSLFN